MIPKKKLPTSAALTALIFCSTFALILSFLRLRSLLKNENGDFEFNGVLALLTDKFGRCVVVVLVASRARAAAASTKPPVIPFSCKALTFVCNNL